VVVAYLAGVKKRDEVLGALAKSFGAETFDTSRTFVGGLSLFMGFDAQDQIRKCLEGRPFIYIDHAYFKRGYEHGNFRVIVNGFHQTGIRDVPGDRLKKFDVKVEPWKRGRSVVVIEPSQNICRFLEVSPHWARETEELVKRHTDRPVRIKRKGPGLIGELRDCHAVVSLSSVAEVEAAKYGIPVFATRHSPASPIAWHDFTKIETPVYPDREAWLRTLSYSQWHVSEMADGTTRRHLEGCMDGDFHLRGT
jgi:hypothetical protein